MWNVNSAVEDMMKESARRLQAKAKRLMQLYSLWHETHSDKVRRQCMLLLGEILAVEPHFSLQQEFQKAF